MFVKREEEKYRVNGRNSDADKTLVTGIDSKEFFENKIACEWLSTEEAAHFLSISANALRIMVHRGQVPVFKFGRRLRFRVQDCRALFVTKGA